MQSVICYSNKKYSFIDVTPQVNCNILRLWLIDDFFFFFSKKGRFNQVVGTYENQDLRYNTGIHISMRQRPYLIDIIFYYFATCMCCNIYIHCFVSSWSINVIYNFILILFFFFQGMSLMWHLLLIYVQSPISSTNDS